MRILFISYEYPPVGGGTGKVCYYLSRELKKIGCDLAILTSSFGGLPYYEVSGGVEIYRVPVIRKDLHKANVFDVFTYVVCSLLKVSSIYDRFKPDIVYAFFTIPGGPIAFYLKQRYSIPFITLLRGQDVPGYLPELSFYYRLLKPLIKLIWRKSSYVISNSQGLAGLARKTMPDLAIKVISNGVNIEKYALAISRNRGSNSIFTILYTGRFVFQKNLVQLMEAFKELIITCKKNANLILIGHGPEEKYVHFMIDKYFLHKYVTILNWQDEATLVQYYQKSDIFVNLSSNEGMPNSVLEAMACGLPIVATDISGNSELIIEGENGFLVPLNNIKKTVEVFLKLINNRGLVELMGKSSRDIIVNKYTWHKSAKVFFNFTKYLLGGPQ